MTTSSRAGTYRPREPLTPRVNDRVLAQLRDKCRSAIIHSPSARLIEQFRGGRKRRNRDRDVHGATARSSRRLAMEIPWRIRGRTGKRELRQQESVRVCGRTNLVAARA